MTVLFTSDWTNFPRAIIHYNTKNKSFLRLAEIYYQMGVTNCAFHLSLLQPELDGVDPYDPNLPLEMKAKVVFECKNNFWYFLREVMRIPVPGSLVPIGFEANRANVALYWLFFNHVMTVIVILRQTGKTTTLMALVTYLLNFGTTNTFINLLTKNEALKAETLSKVKSLFEELPDYLNFSTKKDIFNSDEIKLSKLDNKFKGNLSSSSPKQAEKVGRGFTSPINLIDEAAFVENIAIAMGAMLMSGNAARTAAGKLGKPYGTILATTAGNIDDRDGNYIYRLVTGATTWDENFFDAKDLEELNQLIYTNSNASKNEAKRPIVNITMSYRQLGYGDDWLRTKLAENISTPENIKRDMFNQWISGSGGSPIPREYLELLNDNKQENPLSQFYPPYNYLIRWYISEEELETRSRNGVSIIVGIDTSDGIGRDDITFIGRDHTNGEIVVTATFNEINLITLADFFVSFLLRYSNSTMIIERKSSAATIIDYIIQKLCQKGINPFDRLYNTVYQNKDTMKDAYEEIRRARSGDEHVFTKYKKHIGFVTSGGGVTSRSELYSTTLISMLKYTSDITYDEKLIGQISSLVERNGRIDHPEGGSDDMVIGALLGYWMMSMGRNLSLYGIDTRTLMRSNRIYLKEKFKVDKSGYTEDEMQEREQMFSALLEQFKNESNEVISRQLEVRIRKLAEDMNHGSGAISVEEMLEEIQRDKRVRRLRH